MCKYIAWVHEGVRVQTQGVHMREQAAEDPFNHKPLLKPDPDHPGKVILTKDAIERRKVTNFFNIFLDAIERRKVTDFCLSPHWGRGRSEEKRPTKESKETWACTLSKPESESERERATERELLRTLHIVCLFPHSYHDYAQAYQEFFLFLFFISIFYFIYFMIMRRRTKNSSSDIQECSTH